MSALWRAYPHASILATVEESTSGFHDNYMIDQIHAMNFCGMYGAKNQSGFQWCSIITFPQSTALFGNGHQTKPEELGHPVWTTAYKTQTLFPWLLKRSKPKGGASVECRPLIDFFLSVDDLSSFKQHLSFCLEIDFQSVWNMCIMRNFSAENDWKRIRWRSILITSFCRCFRWIKSNSKICIEAVSHNWQQSWFADIAWVAGETVEALGKVFWGTDNQTIGQ